MAMLKLCMRDE